MQISTAMVSLELCEPTVDAAASALALSRRGQSQGSLSGLCQRLCEMFHFVQHDTMRFGQHLYYYLIFQ